MNRCLPLSRLRLRFGVVLLLLCGLASLAQAFENLRQFPPGAKRATLLVTAPPNVTINGVDARLSPGARIHGPNNMLVMSAALVGQAVPVNYQLDGLGQLTRVWILNQAEQDAQRANAVPVVNFVFGSSAPAVKTDDGKTPFDQLPKFQAKP